MIIIINKKWEIHTDNENYILGNPTKSGLKNCTYYPTLKLALKYCLEKRLRSKEFNIIINCMDEAEYKIGMGKLIQLIDDATAELVLAAGGR